MAQMFSLWWTIAGVAMGSDPGLDAYQPVRTAAGCAISMRPETHPEGAAMRAECRWPEVDPARLQRVLTQYERYPEFVFPISVARIERAEAGRTLVYQKQELVGIADREVLLWMVHSEAAGGARVAWSAASDQPLELASGAVRTPRNTGYWDVGPDPDGGARVVHQIAMDAGGYVPKWLVNLVRTTAFAKIMADVRAFAGGLGR